MDSTSTGGTTHLIREHADFRRLWTAFTITELGSQVTLLAVPLIAVISLRATTFQAAALVAAGSAAFLLIGLPAGAWVDRMRRRRVMITTDLVRAALLLSIPIAYAAGVLSLWWLAAVVLATGLADVFFDLADMSLLPSIVEPGMLVAANARLETSRSVAYAAGPGLSGGLIRLVGAPLAVVVDAVSFLWSAASLSRISASVQQPAPPARASLRPRIAEGFRTIWHTPILRRITFYNTTVVTFWSLERALETVFLVRVVHLTAGSIGLLFSASSMGAVAGGWTATKMTDRIGTTCAMITSALLSNLPVLLIPLTNPGWRLGFFILGVGVSSCFVVAFNVVSVSYRQRTIAAELLGRATASMRFLSWGALPVGSLVGGWLGTALGLRPTLWVASVGGLLGVGWLVGLRAAPDPERAPSATSAAASA